MKLASRALLVVLALTMLSLTASAQTLRSPNDPRNQSPSVGTGGPAGGPTGLFTIYDGSTLRKGEYTFSLAYSNYDRDPGNVDLTVVPGSFQVGLNDYVELFFTMDLYRGIKVNSPQNLSSFYLPNSQLRFAPGVLGNGAAIILGPSTGNLVGALANRAVFRPALCVNAGCASVVFPANTPAGFRLWGQPFVQFPYVGGAGPNFGVNVAGFNAILGPPVAAPNRGSFGSADRFPGIGSPVGSILPGIVLSTSVVAPPVGETNFRAIPSTFTVAPTYLPDAPFLNRTYGESSFSQAVVGAKIRLTAPNSRFGFGLAPMYRFYLDKADGAAGFNQLQRGASAGGNVGDFGLMGFLDARLSRSVNVSVNLGYWANSNPKGQFPSGEFTLLDRPDELLAGIGFDFPVNKYFQPILEVRSTQYVGGRTPNSFENSPVEGLAGVKIYPRRWFGFGFAYRYMANQQDRDSLDDANFGASALSFVGIPGGGITAISATSTRTGFIPSDDPHGYIAQFWIGRRNSRGEAPPKNLAPTVDLSSSPSGVKLAAVCGEGTRPSDPSCGSNGIVSLSTVATDPDNDTLTYRYTATGGRITEDRTNATWDLTGVQPGTYRANVYVNDGNGHEVCDWVTVNVEQCVGCDTIPIPTPTPPCATVSVSGPSGVVQSSDPANVTATVRGASGVGYRWTHSSCATIISGQGSPAVSLDVSSCTGPVTATVEVSGFAPECQNTASTTFDVKPKTTLIKVDSFPPDVRNFNNDKARLDNFANQIQANPGSQAVIITYGSCGDQGVKWAQRQKAYMVNNRGIADNLITIVDGGCQEQLRTDFFIVPQGADQPVAEPSSPCKPCRAVRKKSRRGDDEE